MSKRFRIIAMGGEGIGPEIVSATLPVLRAAATEFSLDLDIVEVEVGLAAERRTGTTFPPDAERLCDEASKTGAGAVLFGAVSDEPIGILRKQYDLFANLRPVRSSPSLAETSPLRPEYVSGVDLLIVRELVSGLYYGAARSGVDSMHGRWAAQEMYYAEDDVRRIVRVALDHARKRRRKVAYVHKGNVIKGVFELWKDVVATESAAYPDVVVSDFLVDNMAMQLVKRPADFDVVLAENLFGDILSDLCAGIVGSIGMVPSASFAASGFGLFESIGGTAPDIAGKNLANPISTILSAALLLRYSAGESDAADAIERAVDSVIVHTRTKDMEVPSCKTVTTSEMGELVARAVSRGARQ